jgi:3-polyprenyl-4-hydroxybenzoate decarboxylase
VALKLWQLLALTSGIALVAGVLFGRYVVPHNGPETTFYRHLNEAFEARRGSAAAQQRVAERTQSEPLPEKSAADYLRATIPALEAYNADHGSYLGVSLGTLQHDYDAGVQNVTIVRADRYTYCVESTVESATYYKGGPTAEILPGRCR